MYRIASALASERLNPRVLYTHARFMPAADSNPAESPGAPSSAPLGPPRIIDLGRMDYAAAFDLQRAHHEEVLAARPTTDSPDAPLSGDPGRILLVEHDPPVITLTSRPSITDHLIATPELLARSGVTTAHTDRGGDITYHGPGQLVVYPILDLNLYRLRLHDYMHLLEQSVIDTLAVFGIAGERDPAARGVWVPANSVHDQPAKICAMGVRIRRWVSMHGLALNVDPDMRHFQLIVPCGLAGRPVTSLKLQLGDACPAMSEVKAALTSALQARLVEQAAKHT
jgi:lipoyl(octanoyl) transferase